MGDRGVAPPNPWCWVPLPSPASTITVAGDSNAIVRLRTAKFHFWTTLPGANWETATCSLVMQSCSRALLRGVASSSGVPSTAIVRPPRSMAVVWATVSIPSANPLSAAMSRFTSSDTNRRVLRNPADEGWRDPTTEVMRPAAKMD